MADLNLRETFPRCYCGFRNLDVQTGVSLVTPETVLVESYWTPLLIELEFLLGSFFPEETASLFLDETVGEEIMDRKNFSPAQRELVETVILNYVSGTLYASLR